MTTMMGVGVRSIYEHKYTRRPTGIYRVGGMHAFVVRVDACMPSELDRVSRSIAWSRSIDRYRYRSVATPDDDDVSEAWIN